MSRVNSRLDAARKRAWTPLPRQRQCRVAALDAALAACHAAAAGDTVIEFWGLGREGEVVQAMMPEFEREHAGVHVRVQQIPWTAAHEKLLTAYVGRATPDV